MIKYLYIYLWLLVVFHHHAVNAQTSHYRLKYGDILGIDVYGEANTKREVRVGPDGTINYLFVNTLPAVGRTIPEVRNDLTAQLKTFYRYPLLNIVLNHFGWDYYTVIGQITAPGIYPVYPQSTILSALCAAHGFSTRLFRDQTVDMVDLDRSFLAHDGEYIRIDFEALLKEGDLSWNFPLHGGDYLFFANRAFNRVFVLGEVRAPNSVEYLTGITLTQAIAGSGGITERASSRIVVIRGSLAYPRWFYIDSNLIFKGCAPDFPLMPNDIVYVPPFQFVTLREIVREGIASFVSIVANVAGTNAFLEMTPAAKNTGVTSPVPVVGGTVAPPPVPAPSVR